MQFNREKERKCKYSILHVTIYKLYVKKKLIYLTLKFEYFPEPLHRALLLMRSIFVLIKCVSLGCTLYLHCSNKENRGFKNTLLGILERHLENPPSPPMVALILMRKIVKETDVICSVVYGLYSSSIFCHDSIYEINIFL